jgi:cytochrome c biogenesis protein
MKALWRFFASVKLAIVLLILLAAASIVGTLIPQGLAPSSYAAHFGRLTGLLMGLQLNGVYHSLWFLTLLFLLALNTIVCTLTRLPAKWRRAFRPRVQADPAGLAAMRIRGRFGRNKPAADVAAAVRDLLRERRYRVDSAPGEARICLLARKRRLGIFGSDTVHLGLLIVILGGIVSGLGGFRTQLALSQGQTAGVPRAPFALKLDSFVTEYYPQGSVKDWKSTVTVLENRAPVRQGVIEVNRPLTYKGFSFYQTSYAWDWTNPKLGLVIKKTSDPSFSRTVSVDVGQKVAVDDKDVTDILVTRFVPDFVIGDGNTIQSRSETPNNPAAQVEGWKGGDKVFSGWIFAKYPDFTQMHSGQETDLSFVLKSYEAPEISVLEAARDPGVGLIWAGCFLVSLGFFLAFYWPPHEVRFVLEESRGRTDVTAAGHAGKSLDRLQAEFDTMIDSLRRS